MKKIALYNPYLSTKGGGEKVCLALAECLAKDLDCEVHLISHDKVDLEDLALYFHLELSGVKVEVINFKTFPTRLILRLPLPGRIKNLTSDIKVSRTVKKGSYDLFINNCYQSNLPSPIKKGVYMCMFPQRLDLNSPDIKLIKAIYILFARVLSRLLLHPLKRSPIDTYSLITANSEYTRSHIMRLWDRESEVLYPICDDMNLRNIKKEKIILNVGRFFANNGENHHKRQDFLLETFSKMTDLWQKGWELHFAGSVAEDAEALKYILKLLKSSNDLPVKFHFNSSYKELKSLYNQATIYWHATGYGSDPEKHPEKQEHFGITTVEAMSAGSIPIVINTAGQKEIVKHGVNGFLWNSQSELINLTGNIASSEKIREGILNASITDAKSYEQKAFIERAKQIFGRVMAD